MKDLKVLIQIWTVAIPMAVTPVSAAIVNGGFESGTLMGWEAIGDASVQQSGIGITPTEGSYQAVITSLCGDGSQAPGSMGCQTTNLERPYSGTNALYTEFYCADFTVDGCVRPPVGTAAWAVFDFIGLPAAETFAGGDGVNGEGSAIRTTFTANAGDTVGFDYNYATMDAGGDYAFFTLLATNPGATLQLVHRVTEALGPSNMQLCERVEGDGPGTDLCNPGVATQETGYRQFSFQLTDAGTYQLGFAVFESEEGTVPSAVLVDNLTLTAVPIPGSIWLLATSIGWIVLWRRSLSRWSVRWRIELGHARALPDADRLTTPRQC